MKKITALTAMLLVAVALAWADTPVERSVEASPQGLVEVENLAGSVTVEGWGRSQVEVTGTLEAAAERLDVDSSGDRTRITVVLRRHTRQMDGSHLTIRVPEASRLAVETVSARIEVSGVSGGVELESVSGDIRINQPAGEIEADSVSGQIIIDQVSTRANVETVSGDIDIATVAGELSLESVSGDIEVRAGSVDRFEASTTSGKIRVGARPAARASVEIESMSGDVELVVDSDLSADFDLSTFSGSIRNAIGPAAERTSGFSPGESVSFTTGSGGARITVSSFSGTVSLVAR